MFFILSKVLGFFALPSNLLITIGLVGIALLLTRSRRLASWLVVTSLVLLVLFGLSPLGNALMLPLEERFPPWDASHGAPDGVIVLGGVIAEDVSAARGAVALNESAERVTVAASAAVQNCASPFGGTNALLFDKGAEAGFAVRQLEDLGVARERIVAEEQSRNTVENAVFSRLIANPQPGQRWLLLTSAFHMPRAIAVSRAAGFPVEAYPVDWRTTGPIDRVRPFPSVSEGLRRTDVAVHEWIGLLLYRLTGKTAELFPGP
jgi:uncharacterized SAM-binding protein YcdF (DUF218 family)